MTQDSYRSPYLNAGAFLEDRRDFLEVHTIEAKTGGYDIFLKLDGGYSVPEEAQEIAQSFAIDVQHLLAKTAEGRSARIISAAEMREFEDWHTVSATPINGYVNIYVDENSGIEYAVDCPAMLVQEHRETTTTIPGHTPVFAPCLPPFETRVVPAAWFGIGGGGFGAAHECTNYVDTMPRAAYEHRRELEALCPNSAEGVGPLTVARGTPIPEKGTAK
ncbi:hypothetical protein [Nocardia sp. CA-119907]|uniref:hypothetical protein n=1 Tax=Nocardia sp. CA-119907 TaxID=3239973 RepID=UPI003D953CF1